MSGPERIEAFIDANLVRTWLVNHSNTFNPERVRCVGQYVRANLYEEAKRESEETARIIQFQKDVQAQRDRYAEALREIRRTGDTDDEGFQYRQIARAALDEVKE